MMTFKPVTRARRFKETDLRMSPTVNKLARLTAVTTLGIKLMMWVIETWYQSCKCKDMKAFS